jgi:hypothetical protein
MDPNGVGCTVCGSHVSVDRIRLLARRDDLAFVEIACDACGSAALGMILAENGPDAGDPESPRSTMSPTVRRSGPPVDANDVIEMREFLDGWDGDFRALFERGTPSNRSARSSW